MVNYKDGKVYKFEFDGHLYIGSTCEPRLSKRRGKHVAASKNQTLKLYSAINARRDGWTGVQITLVESYPCKNSDELRAKERYWI
jgi:hypothetical protein